MAAVAIVAILTAAAEQYAKQLALTVGEGIVETLFNQRAIARDLNEIKNQLTALSEFIRNELPALINQSVDASIAKKVEFDIVEKAVTIKGTIKTLHEARANGVPEDRVQYYVASLIRHAEDVGEMGGTLISYGQPYYASIATAFTAMLTAYAAVVQEAPENAAGVQNRALSWLPRINVWLDPTQPTSFVSFKQWLEKRYALGAKVIPTFETWKTGQPRRVVYAYLLYTDYLTAGGDPSIIIAWAWFGIYKRADGSTYMDGNFHGASAKNVRTIEAALTQIPFPLTMPEAEWWEVRHDPQGHYMGRGGYDQIVFQLESLVSDYYYRYAKHHPVVSKAADLVAVMQGQLASIITATSSDQFITKELTADEVNEMIASHVALTQACIATT